MLEYCQADEVQKLSSYEIRSELSQSENLEAILKRMQLSRYACVFTISSFLSIQAGERWVGYSTNLLAIADCLAIPIFYVARIILTVLHSLNVFSFESYCMQIPASDMLSLSELRSCLFSRVCTNKRRCSILTKLIHLYSYKFAIV
jgi:hypothetical protein